MKEKILKVLDIVLTGLNGFFWLFAMFFKGVIWLFKKIGKGLGFVFRGIKNGCKKVASLIGIGLKKIKSGIGYVWEIIAKLFRGIGRAISEIFDENNGIVRGYQNIKKKISGNIRHSHRKAIWGIIFIIPLMIGFVYFFLLPFLTTLIYSFSNVYRPNPIDTTGRVVGLVTEFTGLDNYRFIWSVHSTFRGTLGDVFVSTLLNVVLVLVFSLIMAVVLNSKFRGRSIVRAIFFMPVIFNSQAVNTAMSAGAALTEAMEGAGQDIFSAMFNFNDFLLDANLPVTAVNFLTSAASSIFTVISYSGIQILLFLAGIQSVPKHLYEAAKIEGATQYEIFWKITFPMVSPLILTAGVYTVVDSFMSSGLLPLMKSYAMAGDVTYTLGLGNLTRDGVYAAMSILFSLVGIACIAIVVLLIKPLVFYYDE